MSQSDLPSQPPARWGTTALWILLVLALAGDAFFVGMSLRQGFQPRRPFPSRDLTLPPGMYFSQLSPETRAKVREQMQARREVFRKQLADVLAARDQVIAAMAAEPFDLAAYRKALEHSAEVEARGREQAVDFFAAVITDFTPEERKAIAQSLNTKASNRRQGWLGRRFGQWRQDGPPAGAPGPQPGPPPEGPGPGPDGNAGPQPPSPSP
ncbi:MAG: periplasmic heavy metal sensor [Alphaproteobacteria bacterium]